MSKHIKTLSRRNFLKGAAYTSALSMAGLSSAAFAACGNKTEILSASSSTTVTLFNQSDKTVALDAWNPVSLEKVNGWVVVKINKASDQASNELSNEQKITLEAGQRHSFKVDSKLAPMLKESGDYIVISNEFSALNNLVPITTFDALVV